MGLVSNKRLTELLGTERDAVRVFDILREKAEMGKGLTADEVYFLCSIFLGKKENAVRKEREVR